MGNNIIDSDSGQIIQIDHDTVKISSKTGYYWYRSSKLELSVGDTVSFDIIQTSEMKRSIANLKLISRKAIQTNINYSPSFTLETKLQSNLTEDDKITKDQACKILLSAPVDAIDLDEVLHFDDLSDIEEILNNFIGKASPQRLLEQSSVIIEILKSSILPEAIFHDFYINAFNKGGDELKFLLWLYKPINEVPDTVLFKYSLTGDRLNRKRFDKVIQNLKIGDEKQIRKSQAEYLKHFLQWLNFEEFPSRFEDFLHMTSSKFIEHEILMRFIRRIYSDTNEDYKRRISADVIKKSEFGVLQDLYIPPTDKFKDSFRISFNDVHFKLGYLSFTKYIEKVKHEVDFRIYNDDLQPEFDYIKFWFAKKLKTKDFKVNVEISISNGEVKSASADAPIISKINADLIESVRIQRTYALNKPPKIYKPDKALFTSDDIFDEINSDDREGNVFNQSEADILKYFLEKADVRNSRQLGYLAGKKQSENHKLLFTLNPHFGFIFFIEGEKSNHFVWELLNSHATYVWSIGKDEMEKETQFKRIEDSINAIRNSGRMQYKNAYRGNHIDNDLVFTEIYHENAGSDFVDGFPLWKARLNEVLV